MRLKQSQKWSLLKLLIDPLLLDLLPRVPPTEFHSSPSVWGESRSRATPPVKHLASTKQTAGQHGASSSQIAMTLCSTLSITALEPCNKTTKMPALQA